MHYQVHKDADGKWYVGTIAHDGEVLDYTPCVTWADAMDLLRLQMQQYGDTDANT